MARNSNRPLSPHLQIWRWGPAMLISILHRATGTILSIGGGVMLIAWLVALASGQDTYAQFMDCMLADEGNALQIGGLNIIPFIILFGISWAFFQHMGSGVRHLVLDIGAGYELHTNRFWSIAVIVGAAVATIALWALILAR